MYWNFKSLSVLTLSILIGISSFANPLQLNLPVEKFRLENGLTVLLHQDRSIPLVTYHTWYKVGSRNEKPGVTGAAHMLEHMMFKGAKKYDGKEFDRILHENGITNNAFTTWDYTGFYQKLPSHKLELMMDMEVDRMRFLQIAEADLKSELQVVGEERRWRVDNNPPSLLRESVLGNLFRVHPYQWPVIGHMADIQNYTTEKLRHFYDTYYVPNNAVLVIAGDIDLEKTKRLVQKYYGKLKPRNLPSENIPPEPVMSQPTRKVIEADVQNSSIIFAYPGVKNGEIDGFALDLLGNILGSGSSSRLYRKMVYEEQLATSSGAYNISLLDPGFFVVMASLKPGKNTKAAEQVLQQSIQKIQAEGVSEKELEKAKNQMMKEFVDGLTTIDGKAQSLAVNEIVFGDYQRMFTDLEKYNSVKAKDIQRVAKLYLNSERRITGILNPKQGVKP
jgi:zinc protease